MAKDPNDLYEAALLNQEYGIGREKPLRRRLRRSGLLDEEGNLIAPEGYEGGFDPATADLDVASRNKYKRYLTGPETRGSVYRKQWQELQADMARKKMDEFKANTIDPLQTSISERLQDLMSRPSFSAEELADMRSELVSQSRMQESNRLKRIGATLGMRGLDPGSAAGAALINQVSEDTDRAITEGLRRFGLDVAQFERQSAAGELALGTQLSTQMAALETALTQGNYEQVFQISNDLGALLEAIKAQEEAMSMQKDANRDSYYGGMASSLIGGASSILSASAGNPGPAQTSNYYG